MTLLDCLELVGPLEVRFIELHQGDILEVPCEPQTDFLVVSAFPGDYLPTPTSLIGQLADRGVSVEELARRKATDLTSKCACWTSEELGDFPYKQLLCFEPHTRGTPPEVVGDIFRAIIPLLADPKASYSAAMPLVATGDQKTPIPAMLGPLLDAAIQWMAYGIALERLMIFVRGPQAAAVAQQIFNSRKHISNTSGYVGSPEFDVFVSYSRRQTNEMKILAEALSKAAPQTRMFIDKVEIQPGTAWEPALFRAIEASRVVVPLYSEDYLQSRVCNDEFNAAFGRWRSAQLKLFPLHVYRANLLPHMEKLQYEDCREGDRTKLEAAASRIADLLEDGHS
jgi:hypothetical protein